MTCECCGAALSGRQRQYCSKRCKMVLRRRELAPLHTVCITCRHTLYYTLHVWRGENLITTEEGDFRDLRWKLCRKYAPSIRGKEYVFAGVHLEDIKWVLGEL
jgi:hypothetical protein